MLADVDDGKFDDDYVLDQEIDNFRYEIRYEQEKNRSANREDGQRVDQTGERNEGLRDDATSEVEDVPFKLDRYSEGVTDNVVSNIENPWAPKHTKRVSRQVQSIGSKWKNSDQVKVYETLRDYNADPEIVAAGRQVFANPLEVQGFYQPGRNGQRGFPVIIASHPANRNIKGVKSVLLHETIGHYGLRNILGDQLNDTLDNIYESYKGDSFFKALASDYNYNLDTKAGSRATAEEYIAHLAETDPSSNFIKDIVRMVRNAFRSMGFNLRMTNSEIASILAQSKNFVTNNDGQKTEGFVNDSEARMKLIAYNGSGRDFKKFSIDKVGTGVQENKYGWGLYFTQKEGIARAYANRTSRAMIKDNAPNPKSTTGLDYNELSEALQEYFGKDNMITILGELKSNFFSTRLVVRGKKIKINKEALIEYLNNHVEQPQYLYRVAINPNKTEGEYDFIDWNEPLTDRQSQKIQEAARINRVSLDDLSSGKAVYENLKSQLGSDKAASTFLYTAGIDGNKYNARIGSDRSEDYNYVVYDDSVVEIEEQEVRYKRNPIDRESNAAPTKRETLDTQQKEGIKQLRYLTNKPIKTNQEEAEIKALQKDIIRLDKRIAKTLRRDDATKGGEQSTLFKKVFHGSHARFDRFDINRIKENDPTSFTKGGWGIYFSDMKEVAEQYTTDKGSLTTADIPNGPYFNMDETIEINDRSLLNLLEHRVSEESI
jgi:hypothetical protein